MLLPSSWWGGMEWGHNVQLHLHTYVHSIIIVFVLRSLFIAISLLLRLERSLAPREWSQLKRYPKICCRVTQSSCIWKTTSSNCLCSDGMQDPICSKLWGSFLKRRTKTEKGQEKNTVICLECCLQDRWFHWLLHIMHYAFKPKGKWDEMDTCVEKTCQIMQNLIRNCTFTIHDIEGRSN